MALIFLYKINLLINTNMCIFRQEWKKVKKCKKIENIVENYKKE